MTGQSNYFSILLLGLGLDEEIQLSFNIVAILSRTASKSKKSIKVKYEQHKRLGGQETFCDKSFDDLITITSK